jgi:Leucine-rich repeat (LRR) protein
MEVNFLFLISLIIFSVKCEVSNKNIGCDYQVKDLLHGDKVKSSYGCTLNYNNYENDDELFGAHLPGKNDDDVEFVLSQYPRKYPVPKIFSLKVCEKFKNLKKIFISRKDVEEIEANILDKCLNLMDFTFTENNLQGIPENLFAKNSKLENLNLQNNQLHDLPAGTFKSLINLKTLSLGQNNLKSLNSEWFVSLQKLRQFFADGNEFFDLQKDIFKPLTNLRGLHLFENNLTVIHSDSFKLPSKLQQLTLNHNKIKAIDRKLIDESRISKVSMYPNVCNNSNMQFREETLMGLKRCFDNYVPREE